MSAETKESLNQGSHYYKAKPYSEAVDPMLKILAPESKEKSRELTSYIIALELQAKHFRSYEVFIFLEENLKIEVSDVSIFRGKNEKPTGIVIARLSEKVSFPKLNQLDQLLFKGKRVVTQMFANAEEYRSYVKPFILEKLKCINLPFRKAVPLVYVGGFPDGTDENVVRELFGKVGTILLIEKSNDLFIIYFSEESAARNAERCFNLFEYDGKTELRVTLFYRRTVDRAFGIRMCSDQGSLMNEIKKFGAIESSLRKPDGTIYVLMESQACAKQACIALNSMKIGKNYICTFFITYLEYRELTQ